MKQFFHRGLVAAAIVAAGGAQAVVLHSNGPVVNANGLSVLTPPASTIGFNAVTAGASAVADDFTVAAGGWTVQSLSFFAYQTGSFLYTFTNATWSVVQGDVNTGAVVASGVTALTDGGLVGYRVTPTTLSNTTRGIYQAMADVPDFALSAGTYWLRWSLAGVLSSGPFQPPTSDARTGNAAQSLGGAAFSTLVDTGSQLSVELPFAINGVGPVPEPATSALMLLGAIGVCAAARRRSSTR